MEWGQMTVWGLVPIVISGAALAVAMLAIVMSILNYRQLKLAFRTERADLDPLIEIIGVKPVQPEWTHVYFKLISRSDLAWRITSLRVTRPFFGVRLLAQRDSYGAEDELGNHKLADPLPVERATREIDPRVSCDSKGGKAGFGHVYLHARASMASRAVRICATISSKDVIKRIIEIEMVITVPAQSSTASD